MGFVQAEATCQATSDNLALSKSTSTNSEYSGRTHDKAVDGQKPARSTNCWMTAHNPSTTPYLQIDMGTLVWVNRMEAMNYDEYDPNSNDRYTHSWTLEAS